MSETLKILEKEKEFCAKSYDKYIHVICAYDERDKTRTNYISGNAITHQRNPSLLSDLQERCNLAFEIGASHEKIMVEQLKTAPSIDHVKDISENLFKTSQNHLIKKISDDLVVIEKHGVIEKDNQQFTTHKAYLEYHVNNKALNPYLQNTPIATKLAAIYKHEEHQLLEQEKQKQQEHEELEQSKALGKDYGMRM